MKFLMNYDLPIKMRPVLAFVLLSLFVWNTAFAQSKITFEDWVISDGEGASAPFIFAVNDSGGAIGQWCSAEALKCHWALVTKTSCKTDANYPALINSDSGSSSATLVCIGQIELGGEIHYRMAMSPFEEVEKIIRDSSRVGVAIPLQNDSFRVFRFSTKGGATAIARMNRLKGEFLRKREKNSTRDVVL